LTEFFFDKIRPAAIRPWIGRTGMRDLADREIQVAGRGFDTSGGKRPDADRKARRKKR
jgi:hypothetical protein